MKDGGKIIKVLMVCTGNICRSPTAEAVLRHKLAEMGMATQVEVDSAATHDYHTGSSPSQHAVDCGHERGYDLKPIRARRLQAADFTDFDLILGMDQGHMSLLTRRRPEKGTAQVALFLHYAQGREADVPDPYYGGRQDYVDTLSLIESAMPGLISNLQRDFF
ncbi:MAG: low molecular weight protein-tyrosine-phosphatase [Pseudomonadota bacterium]